MRLSRSLSFPPAFVPAFVPAVVLAFAGIAGLTAGTARADDELGGAIVIFARGSSLYQVDARGRGETVVAELPTKATVRALRSDASGNVLVADLAGKWAWMPLDGGAHSLTELPCADGPAQLAEDGTAVLCRSPRAANQSILIELARGGAGKVTALDVPPASARIVGSGSERALVWADPGGVWSAPATDPRRRTRLASDPPLRGFLPSPDGDRAVGVFTDRVYTDVHHTQAAEVLMTIQLDNQGARRKTIASGVAVEWSHDGQWILVQDGGSACIMRATGGQYKCWRGYTAASLSADGRWGLALGNRDGSKKQTPAKAARAAAKTAKATPHPPPRPAAQAAAPAEKPWDTIDEPSNEPEAGEAPAVEDDVSVAPPGGPQSLFRIRLEGAFTDRPTLLVKVVDGAAVWISRAP
ncbi:MAG TPA: hypothetical protein VFK02_00300 [Kofleriaceae bacterium]|nr:hypothetical protein [Kofleriaceae bacterium]